MEIEEKIIIVNFKKLLVSVGILCSIFLLSSVGTYASTTYLIHNGKSSEGWKVLTGDGYIVESCGYDDSSYEKRSVSSSGSSNAVLAAWRSYVKPSSAYYFDYEVYIPSCSGTAAVEYKVTYWNSRSGGTYLTVDQSNYSDQWVNLGQYRISGSSSSQETMGIYLSNVDQNGDTSTYTVWYEARFSN